MKSMGVIIDYLVSFLKFSMTFDAKRFNDKTSSFTMSGLREPSWLSLSIPSFPDDAIEVASSSLSHCAIVPEVASDTIDLNSLSLLFSCSVFCLMASESHRIYLLKWVMNIVFKMEGLCILLNKYQAVLAQIMFYNLPD